MQLSSKMATTAFIVLILLMASFTLMAIPVVKAVVYDFKAALSFRPNPVGLGQPILVNLWVSPPGATADTQHNYTVTFTKPDGTKQVVTMNSYMYDSTAWFEYTPDQVGTWKLQFTYPGETIGNNTYHPASTPESTLTVQQEIVYSWPELPLPTDYWTRPVVFENRNWWPILGAYPWYGPAESPYNNVPSLWDELYPNTNPYWISASQFTPWVQGPNSAHIAWKQKRAIGGIIGGDYGTDVVDVNMFTSMGATSGGTPSIIYAGRAYQSYSKPGSGQTSVTYWQCYDIRTGELYWERPLETGESAPTLIEYAIGAHAEGTNRVTAVSLLSISNGYLRKYNPWTGAMANNISIAPLTGSGGTYYMNGYALGIQDLGSAAGANRYRLINWTTFGTTTNVTGSRLISNTTYARSSLPSLIDWNVGLGATISGNTTQGFNLKTGESLWNATFEESGFSGSCNIADHGKVAYLTNLGYYLAWDLYSGKLAWKSELMDYPWGTTSFGAYSVQSAYGLLYREAYDGIYAFNWNDGKVVWKYKAPAASQYEVPYIDENGQTVMPFNVGARIADGKLYTYNTEHTITPPIPRGYATQCINATTGEKIWSVMIAGASSAFGLGDVGPVADGYFTILSGDGYQYVFGKGKSATTVTAPETSVQLGTALMIKGTVLDQSPAQPGTPCISKESMALQMEYLHKQMPIAGIWGNETITGVPVVLTAIGSDGAAIDIGTATTNGYSGAFNLAWTPPKADTYEIIASFAGDDSYGSSMSTTAVSVGPAPAPIQFPEQVTPTDYTMTIVGVGIAIIIAVAIVGLLIFLGLRKR